MAKRAFRPVIVTLVLGILVPTAALSQERSDVDFFNSDGVMIRFLDMGSGDPVLLMHGLGSRLEFWEAAGILSELEAAEFRVIAYDARGHGESEKPYDDAQFGREDVEDAKRLLDHLSVDRAHVVGYSRGSGIAARLLAYYPHRVRKVVLGGWAVGNPIETLSRSDCLETSDLLRRGEFPAPIVRAVSPPAAPLPSTEEQTLFLQRLTSENDMRALAAAFRADCDAGSISSAALRATGAPILAIVGEDDGFLPALEAMQAEMEDDLRVLIIEGADHFTAPRDAAFVTGLVEFLSDGDE